MVRGDPVCRKEDYFRYNFEMVFKEISSYSDLDLPQIDGKNAKASDSQDSESEGPPNYLIQRKRALRKSNSDQDKLKFIENLWKPDEL